jgi:hypothetical protein
MGRVATLEAVAPLSPGGEFVALELNGCYRSCAHLLSATVSNWGGTAFEAAAHALCPAPRAYGAYARGGGAAAAVAVEHAVLARIAAPPTCAVDGVTPALPMSVDGMAWEPQHRQLYEHLWRLAGY